MSKPLTTRKVYYNPDGSFAFAPWGQTPEPDPTYLNVYGGDEDPDVELTKDLLDRLLGADDEDLTGPESVVQRIEGRALGLKRS